MAVDLDYMLFEYFFIRGEVQDGSISGVNEDQKKMAKKELNREMEFLANYKPPFLNSTWNLRVETSVTLQGSGVNTVTGTKNVPVISDSAANLKKRDMFSMVHDGTYRYRVLGASGITVKIDRFLSVTASTGTGWTAYHDVIALPHNVGHVYETYYESDKTPIKFCDTRAEFHHFSKQVQASSKPSVAGRGVFSNKWLPYKHTEVNVTFTNGSKTINISSADNYAINDVLLGEVSSTNRALFTIVGISSTTLYLDREFQGTTAAMTVYTNPVEHTEYLSLYPYPSSEDTITLKGFIKPQDLVYGSELCIFPEKLVVAIIIGALRRNKFTLDLVTPAWEMFYQQILKYLRQSKEASVYSDIDVPGGLFGNTGFDTGDYNW